MSSLYDGKNTIVRVPPLPDDATAKADAFSGGKILIVGAGVAGVFAAYTLEYLGVKNYQVLEATSTVGGRFHATDKLSDDFALDLGAEWCHVNPKVMQDLLLFPDVVKIDMVKFRPETYGFLSKTGGLCRRDFMRFFYTEYKFKRTTWLQYLRDYVLDRVNKDNVHLETPVTSIDYSAAGDGGLVEVTSADGKTWSANKVIVTCSLGVMKQETIKFVPALPPVHREAIQQAPMAGGFKIFFEFKERFYVDLSAPYAGLKLLSVGEQDLVLFYDAVFNKETDQTILGCACVGTEGEAARLALLEEDDVVRELLETLDKMYQGQASKNYVRHDMMNWSQHPFIRGTYSLTHEAELVTKMAQPLNEAVFFAGEHLSAKYTGYMHGAAETGRRAAVNAIGCS